MVFTKDELYRLKPKSLKRLAQYLDINISEKEKKSTIIKKILEKLASRLDTDFVPDVSYLLPGETLERPLYSVRIRRIVQSKLEGEK